VRKEKKATKVECRGRGVHRPRRNLKKFAGKRKLQKSRASGLNTKRTMGLGGYQEEKNLDVSPMVSAGTRPSIAGGEHPITG